MGAIRLYGSTSGYLELQAPAVAPDAVLTLPSDSVQPGLVHLHTETFSAVSSVSIDNVFSSEYDNYLVNWNVSGSTALVIYLRLRLGGSDATTSYQYQQVQASNATFSGTRTTGQTSMYLGRLSTSRNMVRTAIFSPAISQPTSFQSSDNYDNSTAIRWQNTHGVHDSSVAYDGFTASLSSGTITGTLRVYGYRNS